MNKIPLPGNPVEGFWKGKQMISSIHPYEPFVPQGATKLIIGTMPPYRFCVQDAPLYDGDVSYYYGSKDNSFWSVLSRITGVELSEVNNEESIEQRKELLRKNGIGITDIIERCHHVEQKSTDDKLIDVKLKDIAKLLECNQSISELIYTGTDVIKYINQAVGSEHHWLDQSRYTGTKTINNKDYTIRRLKSPSPRAGWIDKELDEDYRKVLLVKHHI